MRSRALVVGSGAATAVLLTGFLAPSAGAEPSRHQFDHVPITSSVKTYTPMSAQLDRRITVSLVLDSPSVVEREQAAGHKLSKAEKAAARKQVKDSQAPVTSAAESEDGQVLREMQDAVNAVTVDVPASALADLAATPGVAQVIPTREVHPSNQAADLFTGVGTAWDAYGGTGTGVKVAVIDTGVDYYHANFGGDGNPADFADDDTTVIEPGTFPTAKVVAGYDLVGRRLRRWLERPGQDRPAARPRPARLPGPRLPRLRDGGRVRRRGRRHLHAARTPTPPSTARRSTSGPARHRRRR